ncbi:MAG: CDP-diacylglycerol--glycerol-3-phosphate 3-phosphatidyltransferase [Clostridia bacterium]|nr:CDP-diacylglycerol--glycerol-3-phosphate 3-phosphatidyltransferase [Clostridia bacterium]MBQ8304021.1 CDP-diacylglycerol--glycerol-3-phosphate 3-phosphatidyltransferase [Clostridia bacterium]
MNLPNKLTVARMLATPVFMLFMMLNFKGHYVVALAIFIAAALTDLFDGKIARQRGIVTDFGKFLDPVADKMLTTAAFLAFLQAGVGEGILWMVFITLLREFLVTSVRLVAASSGGKVIAANIWGKAKTVSQMVAIIFTITVLAFVDLFPAFPVLNEILFAAVSVALWVSTILCAVSGAVYLVQNAEFVKSAK